MTVERNINVLCTRSRCKTAFVTSFDSFIGKEETPCPKCNESWAVHMTDESGNLIHPTEMCPTCCKPALLMERCRCTFYCIKCVNGHEWHTCTVHKKLVVGNGHDRPSVDGCTCGVA